MTCPHCQWKHAKETNSNTISIEPTGNNIFVGEELLDKLIPVLTCEQCGFSWKK